MMTNRRTSIYAVEVDTPTPAETVDEMVARCPVVVTASGVGRGTASVRFRAPDDAAAVGLARQITDAPFRLRTGYGIAARDVDVVP